MPDNLSEYTVKLSRSGKQFTVLSNTSILESGLSAGITLPYGCANGSCGDCKARIVSGHVAKTRFHDHALTATEKLAGICLLCSHTARSDLIIEVSEAESVEDIPFQRTRGKLCHLDHAGGIWIARFKLTRGKALRYLPGQYATVTMPDAQGYTLPIANCPCESTYLEFHVPDYSPLRLDTLKQLDRVMIDGPLGQFTLTELKTPLTLEPATKSVLFVAVDAGFAAVKPLIEHVLSLEEETPCSLIWLSNDSASRYRHNLCRSWDDAFDHFTYLSLDTIAALAPTVQQTCKDDINKTETYLSSARQEYAPYLTALISAGIDPGLISTDNSVPIPP